MAITPVMFNGANSDVIWGKIGQYEGSRFYAPGFLPSIVTGSDRTMRFGTGVALGFGLGGINDANVDVQLDTIGGASFRWDTVVLRLNRSAKTAVVTKVKATDNTEAIVTASDGTASLVFPSGCKFTELDRDAGEWDVPLAMGKVTSTSANLAQLLDIRPHASLWPHTFADPPLAWWGYGALVTLDRPNGLYEVWQRRGSTWVNLTNPPPLAAPSLAWRTGWADNGSKLHIKAGRLFVDLRFRRTGAAVVASASGNVQDTIGTVVRLPAPFGADTGQYVTSAGLVSVPVSPGVATYGYQAYLNAARDVIIYTSVNPTATWVTGSTFYSQFTID